MPLNWQKMNVPDYVKKLMIYQATGETVLHRAARLGYEVCQFVMLSVFDPGQWSAVLLWF
jgi:hypothetical protein